MFRVVRFCVQPYERRGARLAPGEARQFYSVSEALDAAERMRKRVAGAAVYEVAGWPVQDLWGKPKLLARFGEVPRDAA
jgi:hypothetical protein